MSKITQFKKGDIILTTPEPGFFGIAVVLSEMEKTQNSNAKCHIAITPIISEQEIDINTLESNLIIPLDFERKYTLTNKDPFYKSEICIGVYTTRNKYNFKIIGKIDPKLVYNGPLPFEPLHDLDIKWPLYGDAHHLLGREAYLQRINQK